MRYDSSMQESVLQISGLARTYGARTVVNDVSFDVRRGEMFGFLGYHPTPPKGSSAAYTADQREQMQQGLRILARMIVRAHLRRKASRAFSSPPEPTSDRGVED